MSTYDNDILELRQRVKRLETQMASLFRQQGIDYQEEPNQGTSEEIVNLVRQGEKMKAIKLYRQETGASLKQAAEFIDSLKV